MEIPEPLIIPLIGFGGVALGLLSGHFAGWINWRREQKERKEERELKLKRELYLPVITAFTEVTALLVSLPQTPCNELATLKLSPASQSAFAAKDLIANKEVIQTVGAAAKQFSIALSRLMLRKLKESKLAADLDYISASIDKLLKENDQINRHIQELVAQDEGNRHQIETYNRRFNFNQTQVEELSTEQDQKQKARNKLLLELHKASMVEICEITSLASKAIITIRDDLNIPNEKEFILNYYKESIEEIQKTFPEYTDQIWESISADEDENEKP